MRSSEMPPKERSSGQLQDTYKRTDGQTEPSASSQEAALR